MVPEIEMAWLVTRTYYIRHTCTNDNPMETQDIKLRIEPQVMKRLGLFK